MKFTVTHADGTIATRTSKTRVYAFAVEETRFDGRVSVMAWSATRENAAKVALRWNNEAAKCVPASGTLYGSTFRVVPVDAV
jgi:hypothetical protein